MSVMAPSAENAIPIPTASVTVHETNEGQRHDAAAVRAPFRCPVYIIMEVFMTVNDFLSNLELDGVRYIELVTCNSPRMSAAMSYYIDRRNDLIDSDVFDSRERLRAMHLFSDFLGTQVKRTSRTASDGGVIITLA